MEPQAETPEEFDAYLVVLGKTNPNEIVAAANEFEQHWFRSPLCAHVYELEMEARRSLDDRPAAIQAGEKALQGAPNNLAVLAQLAYILSDTGADAQQLGRARDLANNEIEMAKRIRLPRSIPPAKWDETQARLGSMAHSALGMVAYKQDGNLAEAITQFETAASLAPAPDPALDYRLGALYKARGSKAQAIQEFQKAAATHDPRIQPLAEAQLKSLQPASSTP